MVSVFYDDANATAAADDIKLSGIMTSSLHKYRQKHHYTVMHK